MEEKKYEYQETDLELECEICNTVDDWENWEIADFCGIVFPQKNSEQRILIQGIIFICPDCQTENFVSWCTILECIGQSKLSPN